MAKDTRRVYEPLAKVIVTRENIAKIGYVVADKTGSTGIFGKGQWQVRIAYNIEDAQEHRNKLVSYDYVMPFTDDIWAAFERLDRMRWELTDLFHQLRKGKIPARLQPVTQGSLFAIENTRPIGRE